MGERKLIWSADEIPALCFPFLHPLDEATEVTMFPFVDAVGLKRISVTPARPESGKVSVPEHRHHHENDRIYVVSGTGIREMDNDTHTVEAGSFAAFPAGRPANKLTNTRDKQFVYLMGGDRQEVEIIYFRHAGHRMTRAADRTDMKTEVAAADSFKSFDFMARMRDNA